MNRRALIGLAVLSAVVWLPRPANAFVRSTTSTGTPLEWRNRCTEIVLDREENPEFSHNRLRAVLERSMAAWNTHIDGCTEYSLSLAATTVKNADVDYDDRNAILWRLPGFCDDPGNSLEDVCLSPSAAAITTVFYIDKPGDSRDGELVEADIVINADGFTFSDDGAEGLIDLESVMTHELGHFMGLDHTCITTLGAVPPVDHLGNEVQSCFPLIRLDKSITDATMFNFVVAGETLKRTTLDDEWQGICAMYADHTGECLPAGGCGCRTSSPAAPGSWLLYAGVLVALLRRRRP